MKKLNLLESSTLFGAYANHAPVVLARLRRARVLWINYGAISDDNIYFGKKDDYKAYEEHIIRSCAYEVVSGYLKYSSFGDTEIGYADRYGGAGIGHNGGSGRAVVVNGYHVKGVGQTPLVSTLPEEIFSTGEAYLEECIREVIFSEIVAHDFPHSSVPVLAIIDTGLNAEICVKGERKFRRRTLLVRPCFLRPAHFERAGGFVSCDPKSGAIDQRRVEKFFSNAILVLGREELEKAYSSLWGNWARQLAHSFVARLLHGSNTISNISLDGRLVDFGAMSSVPSWSNISIGLQVQPFVRNFNVISDAVRSLSYYFWRYFDKNFGEQKAIEYTINNAQIEYNRAIAFEVLRIFGIEHDLAFSATSNDRYKSIFNLAVKLINHFQKTYIDLASSPHFDSAGWDIELVWSDNTPIHLKEFRSVLNGLMTNSGLDTAASRCLAASSSRPNLSKEILRLKIYSSFEENFARSGTIDVELIYSFIGTSVAESRRNFY